MYVSGDHPITKVRESKTHFFHKKMSMAQTLPNVIVLAVVEFVHAVSAGGSVKFLPAV